MARLRRTDHPDHEGRKVVRTLKDLWRNLIHGCDERYARTTFGRVLRWSRFAVVLVASLMTFAAVLLVAGAWRNDLAIESNMGVAAAEVLSAGPRRSAIEFVTPDRVTYRPELGVLYPSELDTGMRIYVEYDKSDPNVVRVQHRNASLAIIPAGSIIVVSWLTAAVLLTWLMWLENRLVLRSQPVRVTSA
jgi:hypothetical protein